MNLKKLFFAPLLLGAVVMFSCNSKSEGDKSGGDKKETSSASTSAKDVIVNKWVLSDVTAEGMPDSVKAQMIGKVSIELKADGTYAAMTDGKEEKGTWKLSDDGKSLTTTEDGKTEGETVEIAEISKDKAVFNSKKDNMTMTMKADH